MAKLNLANIQVALSELLAHVCMHKVWRITVMPLVGGQGGL